MYKKNLFTLLRPQLGQSYNPLFTCFYDDGSVTLIGILSGLFRHLQLKCFILKRVFEPSSAFKRVEAGANTILDPSISAFCLTGEQA